VLERDIGEGPVDIGISCCLVLLGLVFLCGVVSAVVWLVKGCAGVRWIFYGLGGCVRCGF